MAIGPLRMVEMLNPAEKAPVEAALRMVTADGLGSAARISPV